MTFRTAIRTSVLILAFLAVPFHLAGQDHFSTPLPPEAWPAASEGISERPVSIKALPTNFFEDQKTIWKFPVDLAHGKHWKPTLGVVGVTAALIALDPHDTPYFRRTASFIDFNKAMSGRNTVLAMTAVPATFYLVGFAKKDSYAEHTALLAGEAVADAEVLVTLMKDASRRRRPSDIDPQHGNFGDTWYESRGSVMGTYASFPSGHTIAAFSIATIVAERYKKHRWVPWVSYGLAGLVGFSRITQQAHFPSDVFVGAALGYFLSRGVVLQNH